MGLPCLFPDKLAVSSSVVLSSRAAGNGMSLGTEILSRRYRRLESLLAPGWQGDFVINDVSAALNG